MRHPKTFLPGKTGKACPACEDEGRGKQFLTHFAWTGKYAVTAEACPVSVCGYGLVLSLPAEITATAHRRPSLVKALWRERAMLALIAIVAVSFFILSLLPVRAAHP